MRNSAKFINALILSLVLCFTASVVLAEDDFSMLSSDTFTVTLTCTNCSAENYSLTVPAGDTATFNITPDLGYDFFTITDGATYSETVTATTRTGIVTYENVTEDVEISITFTKRLPITLSVGSSEGAPGDYIDIPLIISENSGATLGVCNVFYDTDILEFSGTHTTGCIPTGTINVEPTPVPGKLGMYFISPNLGQTPVTDGGPLIYMTFLIKEEASAGTTPLTIYPGSSDNHNTYIDDFECTRDLNVESGSITINSSDDGKYVIKTEVSGGIGGTVTNGGRYAPGETITLTAKPSAGYVFSHWEAETGTFDDTTKSTAVYTVGEENVTVYAHFKLRTYTPTTSVSEGGEIILSKNEVEYGGSITVTPIAYPGFELYTLYVGNTNVTSQILDGSYTLTGIKSTPRVRASFIWRGADIIEDIYMLRSYSATFNNKNRTIVVNAYNTNSSAGFGLKIAGDETAGNYKGEKDKMLSRGQKDGIEYVVARRSAGDNQTFNLYIKYMGYEYTYKVTFNFTSIPITDFVITGAHSADVDNINKKISIKADRYIDGDVGFNFVLPTGVSCNYAEALPTFTTSEYTSANGKNHGVLEFMRVCKNDGHTQEFKVTLTDSKSVSETYTVKVFFRDLSFEGNVVPTDVMPLRISSYTYDTENKVIYATSKKGANSAGISFDFNGEAPVKYTTKSGQGLCSGTKNGYKYYVIRGNAGETKEFVVKIYGQDGYEYSWYTVYLTFI